MRGLLIILLLSSFLGRAQTPFTRDFYLNESNTPVKVNAMVQDTLGYIWLGTNDGLYRYNGVSFIKYPDSVHSRITALAAVNDKVWVGYANGKIGGVGNAAVVAAPVSGISSSVNCIKANGEGTLWIGTEDQGLFVFTKGQLLRIDESKGISDNFIYAIKQVDTHIALLGTDNGINIVALQENKLAVSKISTANGLPDNIVRVIKKMPMSSFYIIGTQQGGIAMFSAKDRQTWTPDYGTKWAWGQVNDILPLSANHAWVATEDGYLLELKFKDNRYVEVIPKQLLGKKLKKLLLDKSGNIWVATDLGLTMLTSEYLTYIPLDMPYLLRTVSAITYDSDGSLWFAQGSELYNISLHAPVPSAVHILHATAAITSLYVDQLGHLWIGTLQGLMYKGHSSNEVKQIDAGQLKKESILNITGVNHEIWVAGLNGVEQLNCPLENKGNVNIRHYGKESGIGTDYVYQLYPDRKQNIWMATDGAGVCMYNGASYLHWDSTFKPNGGVAYTVTQDLNGNIWAGAFMKDLYYYHNGIWTNVRKAETHNIDINISSVMANGTGQVISVYQRCIDEWYPKSQGFRHFNSRMHIGIDSTSGIVNCVTKDNAGNVYVPFEKGITIFKNQDRAYDIRPAVHISRVDLNNLPVDGKRKFDYDENYLSFNFSGINYTNPERLNYRYMLKGYNNDWINTNDETSIFSQLPPGKYEFKVQASLNSDFSHAIEDSYPFTIALPFWKEPWFVLLAGLGCFGLIYLYIKLREKNLQRVSLLEQERMMFEYEHLKSQVNPHFLFNSLNTLTSLIDENKDTAISYTEHLSDLYRNMLTYRNQDLIFLSEEWAILADYIHIQKSRFESALQVKVDIPDTVMRNKKIVPLALQLLVENAIKHNVVSNAQPLIIEISASDEEITVKNNIQPKLSKEKSAGIGLVNIKKRYGLLSKRKVLFGVHENQYIVTLPLL